jgi:transposase
MKQDIRESRYDEVSHAEKQLKSGKRIKNGLYKYFKQDGQINMSALAEAEKLDGYSCLFSTKVLSNDQIIKIYFEKDLVEKAFRNLNGVVSLRPIRHWLYDRVVGHIFICYLSLLLLSLFKNRLDKAGLEISPVDALRELETMYKVYLKDSEKGFELERTVKMSKLQEQILNAVDKGILKS